MTSIRTAIRRILAPEEPLPAGLYHWKESQDSPTQHRMHLRIEQNGTGILVIDASTVLHLNQTAAEYAYYLVAGNSSEQAARQVSKRYRVPRQKASQDYREFIEKIHTLVQTPDLDPVMYLNIDREAPHDSKLSAPLRLDCALTYQLTDNTDDQTVPLDEVKRELSKNEWKTIIDKAWYFGIPHLVFTGGEPTQRDDLAELISYAEANGQVTGVFSDGLRMSDLQYLDQLLQAGLDYLLITLSPENKNSWKALTNILAADIYVVVHITITLDNALEAPELLQKLARSGVKAISLTASDSTLQNTLDDLRNLAAELELRLVWDLPVPYSSFNPVSLETQQDMIQQGPGQSWLYVEPDGDILPGQGIHQVLGNILTDSWDKLWP